MQIEITTLSAVVGNFTAVGQYDVGGATVNGVFVDFRLSERNGGSVEGAANNGSGLIRIKSTGHNLRDGDQVTIMNVRGTVEANGTWIVDVVGPDLFDLKQSAFQNQYTTMGTWSLTGASFRSVQVENHAPTSSWSQGVRVNRRGDYEVRLRLHSSGTPFVIYSHPEHVTVDI